MGGCVGRWPVGVHGEEVVVFQPGSKNGWLGQGTTNIIYSDPDAALCVSSVCSTVQGISNRAFFKILGPRCPLFTLTNGAVIHRDLVESTLRRAAQRLNFPTRIFSRTTRRRSRCRPPRLSRLRSSIWPMPGQCSTAASPPHAPPATCAFARSRGSGSGWLSLALGGERALVLGEKI